MNAPNPISPQEARALLEDAIRQRLGDDWEGDDDGWVRVTGHDYMARVSRGRRSLDFYVDLLGQVTVEETSSNPRLNVGLLLLAMMIGLSLVIALIVVNIVAGG